MDLIFGESTCEAPLFETVRCSRSPSPFICNELALSIKSAATNGSTYCNQKKGLQLIPSGNHIIKHSNGQYIIYWCFSHQNLKQKIKSYCHVDYWLHLITSPRCFHEIPWHSHWSSRLCVAFKAKLWASRMRPSNSSCRSCAWESDDLCHHHSWWKKTTFQRLLVEHKYSGHQHIQYISYFPFHLLIPSLVKLLTPNSFMFQT